MKGDEQEKRHVKQPTYRYRGLLSMFAAPDRRGFASGHFGSSTA
jgi:hypothetical protein